MGDNNTEFLSCFVEAMDKVLVMGYKSGELVPTGAVNIIHYQLITMRKILLAR